MRPGIRLGRLFGMDIGLHYSWFIIALVISFSLVGHSQVINPQWGPALAWIPAPSAPQLSNITTAPDPPANNHDFVFTLNGSGFDQQTAVVIFANPGCPLGCTAETIYTRSPTQITGAARLVVGTYSVIVRNGNGPLSINSVTITVADGQLNAPQLNNITTTPNVPAREQDFTFTLNGGGFDPQAAFVVFTGSGCPTGCPAETIHARSPTQITGSTRLEAGTYSVSVRNGNGPISTNALMINVADAL